MSAYTLDDMSAEQLRELSQRAQATADKIEADKKAAKDIIPGVGETWKYNGRLFTVVPSKNVRCLVSCGEKGGDFQYYVLWEQTRFSEIARWSHHPVNANTARKASGVLHGVAQLALIAAGQLALDP